jgi:hypothetical protein
MSPRIDAGELEARLQAYDWSIVMYDPLHDTIEASTDEEKQELAAMEQLINDLKHFYLQLPEQAIKLIERYWNDKPMEHWMERIKSASMKESEDYKGLETEHVIANEVVNKAERESLIGSRFLAYNTGAYFLSQRQVEFFADKQTANAFILQHESKGYKLIEFDSVQDMLRKIPYGSIVAEQQEKYFLTTNTTVMNEQNMQYLKDNLKYMGFGEGLHSELENQLKAGKTDFQLEFKGEMNKKPFEATLNFRKSDNTDMYFFNSYHAKLERTNGQSKEQTFYLDKGKGITAKEAFNLLEGRAVHKDLTNKNNEPYKAWVQLDFGTKDKHNNFEVKQYHENYGYDLRAAVGKLSIAEMGDPEKEKSLMQSLQKGNMQSVTMDKDGSSVKMFVEANPQFKTVNMYDASMKRVQKEDVAQYQSKAVVKEPEQSLKQENQKKSSVKKEKPADSLLPKKRTSQKKGLGIS